MLPLFWSFIFIVVILIFCLRNERYIRNVKRYKSDLMSIGIALGITAIILISFIMISGR
ncbi:hypothetical protein M5C72_10715 [Companilactobacillus allii]|uniref:hypothetical protein n=1 Tax=Companilactobacillus allii TaxID=1847728 RepID=UPI0012FFBAF3|nr:hypothetical protein [Companilactobacillus allii]USQ68309.1 hypothetical protein M5C72_10715 [Companilactobacillus allii]